MEDEDILKEPDEPVEDETEGADDLDHEVVDKKKKDLLNPEETESLDDLEDEELEDEEEPFDDVNPI
ncbi:MAG: hypothetical protein A3J09_02510 [Candidatus Zambryskibacteria bacterium RIFCSPLOWO2_02_FULL_51_21]|uniref:Uncharacterized protein n=1 Tax=Candidatus Zambryskibacteria bacterium RIFCSPHIGHO2_02_FULL_43_37 TaxID=1802749 RepID=A0A1G2TH08_9BACT|nr:MAG: hypothetical protein A2723_02500 [Candidatus Zambryskibacteria bacterium RIFCSPHIGHO2_01_FULL_52_18]OHA96338.1 MAG: hypothetical protein A3D49_00390 [Candidatus Zambryskibacteria bacterium RIFCSPHIGHO2_02_FULL_43_37]OHB07741.1 MAG: hypothetical protein A2944_00265 [Candidatus Zambryskibacteria bacterium RIFCSPLOWO2_01_FULL_52_12]OHB11402.1 MAG: hypothetical protein A3J09_02510 [Candidatus Zambryskibacteria bacterium RIFCSPLOWO2_02_FULL_51_21]